MVKRFLALLLLTGVIGYAKGGCLLEQSGQMDVIWQAYKTPEKIGVKGTFHSVTYTPARKKGENFKKLFVGATVHIDTASLDTGNSIRDQKVFRFFFKQLGTPFIEGKIISMKADPHTKGTPRTGTMEIELYLNGKRHTVTLAYHYADNAFKAQGNIDLLDFAAGKALATINKACFDLHKGKTWRDVSIGFITTVKATLCHTQKKKR